MKNLFIFFIFLFIGCSSHPKVGDWYEHKGTHERIKIEFIGMGKDVIHYILINPDSIKSYQIVGHEHRKEYSIFADSLKMFAIIQRANEPHSNCIFALPLNLIGDYSLVP